MGRKLLVGAIGILVAFGFVWHGMAYANTPATDFNLQVTPSPLVATVKPGSQARLQLKIYDGGTGAENLKITSRSFSFDSATGNVNLTDNTPAGISSWIKFSAPTFTVRPGQWLTESIQLNIPKDAGFSYSFALIISPQNNPKPIASGRVIKGSLAVFTLINVDRPGATSNLKPVSFTSSKRLYEYLPATLNVRLRNDGNTIVQPHGNIFVGRTLNAKKPLATLAVNADKRYILPGTERTFSTQWNDGFATYQDGFATYQTTHAADGSVAQHLAVDWSKLSRFRIGKYTTTLVAVYSDGSRDVPIEGTVSFWVVPWRAILCFLAVVIGLWLFAHWRGKRRTEKAVRRALSQVEENKKANKT